MINFNINFSNIFFEKLKHSYVFLSRSSSKRPKTLLILGRVQVIDDSQLQMCYHLL